MADKIVNFDEYCFKCEYYKRDDNEPPCDICLEEPANEDSHKPVCFKEKEK